MTVWISEICEMAKVVSIVDFFDAITSKRSYHEPLSVEDAINLMSHSVDEKIDAKIPAKTTFVAFSFP